jgi:hypothetical protein
LIFKFRLDNKDFEIKKADYGGFQNLDNCETACVALVDNELILFKPNIKSDESVTYLVDYNTGEIFAIYYGYSKESTIQ